MHNRKISYNRNGIILNIIHLKSALVTNAKLPMTNIAHSKRLQDYIKKKIIIFKTLGFIFKKTGLNCYHEGYLCNKAERGT